MVKKIFWISSYPKSGNTWMRAIVSSLFFSNDGNFKFKYLDFIPSFENVKNFNFVKNISLKDFNNLHDLRVISKYWIESQKRIEIYKDSAFFKSHSAALTINNNSFTNNTISLGCIYLVRDPRDIVISYANHQNKKIEEIIELLSSDNAITFTKKSNNKRYPILLSRWDVHYNSWKNLNLPKIIIRYENLISETETVLEQIISFFQDNYNIIINNHKEKIKNIVNSTNFKKFQKHEIKHGFKESKNVNFFRVGKSGQWKNKLDNKNIKKIEDLFSETMEKLNYL